MKILLFFLIYFVFVKCAFAEVITLDDYANDKNVLSDNDNNNGINIQENIEINELDELAPSNSNNSNIVDEAIGIVDETIDDDTLNNNNLENINDLEVPFIL